MTNEKSKTQKDKISSEFASRLIHFESQQKVRVVVLLNAKDTEKSNPKRQSRAERKAAIEAIRKSAKQALSDIDNILERFGGQRLSDDPDSLGSISIEITADGIKALAESEWVNAILEDQKISPIL